MLEEHANPVSTSVKPPVIDRPHRGPHTVLNPEGRPAPATISPVPLAASAASTPRSSLVRVLFPAEGDDAAPPFDHAAVPKLGHYVLTERIRSGGMGAVFRAVDSRLNRDIALKVLPPALSRDPAIAERFRREAQLSAQLDHPHIARVYDVGEDHGLQFIAFEYIAGTNVRDLIVQHGRLGIVAVLNYAVQIARALVHTSARGIVHRDIKPSNIIITPDGLAKLVDMGLARSQARDDALAELTAAGTTLGTFDYIAPEQARDPRSADTRSDIYSLGCTLYHMLTAEPPYPEGTVLQKLLQHQGDDAPDPASKNSEVPTSLSAIIRRMMAKDPKRRYQSPVQLVRDLNLTAQSLGLRSDGPEGIVWLAPPPGPSFWQRNLAAISTAGLVVAIVGWLEFGRPATAGRTFDRKAEPLPPAIDAPRDTESTPVPGTAASGVRRRRVDDEPAVATGSSKTNDSQATGLRQGARELVDVLSLTGIDRGADLAQQDEIEGDAPADIENISPVDLTSLGPTGGESRNSASAASGETGSKREGVASRPGGSRSASGTQSERAVTSTDTESASDDATTPDDEGFYLVGRDGALDKRFATLEAACAAVRVDGAVIELRFNGKRRETGLRISRRITIRADQRYSPVVEFSPTPSPDAAHVRAVSVTTGALDVVGCSFTLLVGESTRAESWALFSLDRPDSLHLQGTVVTLVNPQARPAAAIEWHGPEGAMMPDMPIAGAPVRTPLNVELTECLVRGDGDLFVIRRPEPVRLEIRQSAIAVRGSLLHDRVVADTRNDSSPLELRLDHVTAVLGDSLVRVDCATEVRKPPQIQVTASNSIFSAAGESPLVTMAGSVAVQDFRAPFAWVGQYNFYDRFSTFWNVVSREGTGRAETWDFSSWRKHWPESAEANPRVDAVVWQQRAWQTTPFADLGPMDFTLDRKGSGNQAPGGAGDSTDAGANLLLLPRLLPISSDSSARDRSRS